VSSNVPLRELAADRLRIGAAVEPAHLEEPEYAATLAREFNQVEPENAMKFVRVHPGPVTYNFGPADSLVAFAQSHRMAVRGHTLVWHQQLPSWLTGGRYSFVELSSILADHIYTVVKHFAGQVYAWDVVNEAFNDDGSLRSTLWSDAPGIGREGAGYIEQALRWAHAADPNALLFYNDFGAEPVNAKSDAIYRMARDFLSRGVPLDGIGLQMHLRGEPLPLDKIDENLTRLEGLGLQVQITELDVGLPVDAAGKAAPPDIARQAEIYADVVALCLKHPRCTAIQTWGFTDKYSWIPSWFPGNGSALEFDAQYQPKRAYEAMEKALRSSFHK